MKPKQAIRFITESLQKAPTETTFTVERSDTSKMTAMPQPIGITITGTLKGHSTSALLLVHPDRPFNAEGRRWLLDSGFEAAKAIVRRLAALIQHDDARAAAKNN